ncbi:MAG: hypothetical protein WCR21_12430, partial [Bacteroidota bacterium]
SISSLPTISCSAGYFNIYMDQTWTLFQSTATQTLICQIFKDISAFVSSPLTNTSINVTNSRVNIFVGGGVSTSLVMAANSFYLFPPNATNPNQGIIDGQVYKAITTGFDPYLYIPTTFSSNSTGITNVNSFYHGYVSINPNQSFNWDITALPNNGQYDAYTFLLHEICHMLGIASLIGSTGVSIYGANNNYYTRYNTYLTDPSYNSLIVPTSSACPNNSLTFAVPISVINSTNSGCITDITTCSNAVHYSSFNLDLKVYTPNCFESSSSLSHFEDMCASASYTPPSPPGTCTPSPPSPGLNNMYFVMANASGYGGCFTKRYLKGQEYEVLCNLGYSLTGVYQSTPTALIDGTLSFHTYSGFTCATTSTVFGINDGIYNGLYTFTTNTSSISIPTYSILANDYPSSGLSIGCGGVEVIYNNTVNPVTTSISGSSLIINAAQGSGLIILKYYPQDGNNITGNATYIFVYFSSQNCNPPNTCNLVQNGGFESTFGNTGCGPINSFTGAIISCWDNHNGNASLISRNCSTGNSYNLNSNTIGTFPLVVNSFNGTGNDKVVALKYSTLSPNGNQIIKNNISAPLVPGNSYRFSMIVQNPLSSLLLNNQGGNSIVVTVCTNSIFPFLATGIYPANLNVIAEFTIPATSSWTQVSQTFTFNPSITNNHSSLIIGINSAKTNSLGLSIPHSVYCYLDEVSLLPVPSPSVALGFSICGNASLLN